MVNCYKLSKIYEISKLSSIKHRKFVILLGICGATLTVVRLTTWKTRITNKGGKLRGIVFGPTGGLLMYSQGIAAYMEDTFELSHMDYCGVSGGSQCALYLASGISLDTALKQVLKPAIYKIHHEAPRFPLPNFDYFDYYKFYLRNLFEVTHLENVRNKLFVYYTTFPLFSNCVCDFLDFDDCFQAIKASHYLPFLCWYPCTTFRNKWCFDGWLSRIRYPDGKWYYINPFRWRRYYYYQGITTLRFLSNIDKQMEFYKLGYNDAMARQKELIDVGFSLKVKMLK